MPPSGFYLCPRSSVLNDGTRREGKRGVGNGEKVENPGGKEEVQADRLGSLDISVRAPPKAVWPGPYKQLLA